jgi:hypothetical protein
VLIVRRRRAMKTVPPMAAVAASPAPITVSVLLGPIEPPRPPSAPRAASTLKLVVAVADGEFSRQWTVRV